MQAEIPESTVFVDLLWSEYEQGIKYLHDAITADGYTPDIILGISRGGLVPCASLAYHFDNKNVYIMNVEFYTSDDRRLEAPIILPPYLEMTNLEEHKVLIVDEIADSGKTLIKVQQHVEPKVAEVRTAVLYRKPWSGIGCDYVWRETRDWINFPWVPEKFKAG